MLILLLLTLVNLLNYLDRYILPALAPAIQKDLGLSDMELGLLSSAFMITYFAISPIFGWLGDKKPRFQIISVGVALWSCATAASGLARSFTGLFVSRLAVGVGEASYATISPPLLGDLFPKSIRGRIFAIFFMAIPVGSALGYLLGGLLESSIGWRGAFFVAGGPGLLLALVLFFMKDPSRGQHDKEDSTAAANLSQKEIYKALWRNRGYVLTVLGYAAYTFTLGGLATWMPTYLVRFFDISLLKANTVFGGVTVVGGFVGTLVGGFWADRWGKRSPDSYLKISALSVFLAGPLFLIIFNLRDFTSFCILLFVIEFLLFLSTSPISAQVVNCVPVFYRATANAVSIFAIHLLGDAISPTFMGWVSDQSDLRMAMLLCPLVIFICGFFWLSKVIFVWEAMDWPKDALQLPKSQCHRGYHLGGIQENTLEAFREAARRGATMTEMDVQLSRDGIPVVIHDETIDRVSARGHKGLVSQFSAEELRKYANVPMLSEVLADSACPRLLNIELKSASRTDKGLEKAVANIVKEQKAESRVLFSSFNPLALRRISRYLPRVPRALLVTEEKDQKNKFYLRKMLMAFLAKPHLVHMDYKMFNSEWEKTLRSRGIKIALWTVNDSKKAKEFMGMGVKSLISDEPEILRA